MEKRFYTTAEAAAVLNVSPRTIRRLIRSGRMPAVSVKRSYRIPIPGFERFKAGEAPQPFMPAVRRGVRKRRVGHGEPLPAESPAEVAVALR